MSDQKEIKFVDLELPGGFVVSGVQSGINWMQFVLALGGQVPPGDIPKPKFRFYTPGKQVFVAGTGPEIVWLYNALTNGLNAAGYTPSDRWPEVNIVGIGTQQAPWHATVKNIERFMNMKAAIAAAQNGAKPEVSAEETPDVEGVENVESVAEVETLVDTEAPAEESDAEAPEEIAEPVAEAEAPAEGKKK